MSNLMNRRILWVNNLTKEYGKTVALDNVTFSLEEKGFIFINGISGSGKTTLMNLMSGLDSPTSGRVYYNDKDITEFNSQSIDDYRNSDIGIVFQNFNLIDDMTVEENLLLPLTIQNMPEDRKSILVDEVLDYVGLYGYNKRKGYELSAGQKQRVAIARAIIKRPKILFADEATGNLDSKNTDQILNLFNDISKSCLVVLISHNNNSAQKYADRIITLDDGKICSDIDNRQLKELYLEPYKIFVSGHGQNKEIPLEDFDIKSEIKELIDKSGSKLDTYSFNTKIVLETESNTSSNNWIQLNNTEIRTMSFAEIIKCVLRFFNKNKIKNFLVTCLFAFMSLLFFLLVVISKNDYFMSLSKYINNKDILLYDVKKVISSDEGENEVYKGEEIYTQLTQLMGTDNVIKGFGTMFLYKEENMFSVTAFKNCPFFEKVDITGTWPLTDNEIAVSSKFADSEEISIGSYISSDEHEYKIVGIYDGLCLTEENAIVLFEDYNNDSLRQSKAINLQACNVLKSVAVDEYTSEIATVGKISNIQSDNLIWGKMPEKQNEIVVSSHIFQETGMTLNDTFVTKYRLHDIYNEKYNNDYDSFINLYNYIGKNVELVGIYDSEEYDERGDILIQDDGYQRLIDFYTEYLDYELLYVNLDKNKNNYNILKSMTKHNIRLCDDVCTYIYAIQHFFGNMKNVMKILLCAMLLMLGFMIVSFLSYNVKESSKTIGIYKSLGIRNVAIAKIFVFENLIITLASLLIANILLGGVIGFINAQIFGVLNVMEFDLFIISPVKTIFVNIIILFISMIATIVPISILVKRETVNLMNRDE